MTCVICKNCINKLPLFLFLPESDPISSSKYLPSISIVWFSTASGAVEPNLPNLELQL